MKFVIKLVSLMLFCSVGNAQQAQTELTPEQKQHYQEQADALERATESLKGLADATNAIVRDVTKACVVTGVSQTRCACLANNIPIGIGQDKEIWGTDSTRTAWVAYVSLITLPMTESELLDKLKTANAKKIVQTAFKARYTCN